MKYESNNWLGCMLSTDSAGRQKDDIDHRLQNAALAFHVHTYIFCDKMVLMASRPQIFDVVVQMMFENLTCIAGNCLDVLWVRHLTSVGSSPGT